MKEAPRVLLALSMLVYTGIGLWTFIDPITPLRDVGVTAIDDRGLVELRAMYGGLELGMAAFLGWCLASPTRVRIGLLAATMSIGGLGIGRTLSWLVTQPEGMLLPLLCVVEVSGCVMGGLALWLTRE